MDSVTTTQARADLSTLINRVHFGGERIQLTRRGKVIAVVVPAADGIYLDESEDDRRVQVDLAELFANLGVSPEALRELADLIDAE